mmetsp:Transcript_23821/g.27001  ORF Transcript_23821/g.27001 Transcript_23821/m.27001 type:complete len:634 (-) Transcript_23821:84-1985(-)
MNSEKGNLNRFLLSETQISQDDQDCVFVSWRDIEYKVNISDPDVRNASISDRLTGKNRVDKTIIDNVSGHAAPGEVLFLMGPSGAGKTSLLNILGQRMNVRERDSLTGELLLNGMPYKHKLHHQLIGYVMQDDAIFAQLTPRESLEFITRLKYSFATKAEYDEKVNELIFTLRLQKCADTRVGDALQRGISGGERKRTCIALELVSQPRVLYLDEPTSGLDSINAENVLRCLRRIARKFNTTIITTIHQPNSSCYNLSDRLILLQHGRSIYQGPTQDAVSYFSSLGHTCPQTSNPADYFMLLLNPHKPSSWPQQTTTHHTTIPNHQKISPNSPVKPPKTVSTLSRLTALCKREIKLFIRNPKTLGVLLIGKDVQIFIIWAVYKDLGTGMVRIMNINGFYFYLIALEFMCYLPAVAETLPVERPVFMREAASGVFSPVEYVWIKLFATLPLTTFITLHFNIIVFWIVDINHTMENFGWFLLTVYVLSFVSMSMGMVIGSIAKDVGTTMFLIPLVALPLVSFEGYFANLNSINWGFRWLAYCSPLRYAFEAVLVSEYTSGDPSFPIDPLEALSFSGPSWKWILVLVAITIGFCFLAMFFVMRRVAEQHPKEMKTRRHSSRLSYFASDESSINPSG